MYRGPDQRHPSVLLYVIDAVALQVPECVGLHGGGAQRGDWFALSPWTHHRCLQAQVDEERSVLDFANAWAAHHMHGIAPDHQQARLALITPCANCPLLCEQDVAILCLPVVQGSNWQRSPMWACPSHCQKPAGWHSTDELDGCAAGRRCRGCPWWCRGFVAPVPADHS